MDVVCPHIDRCTSYPYKCHKCKHNINNIIYKYRRDYFEPI